MRVTVRKRERERERESANKQALAVMPAHWLLGWLVDRRSAQQQRRQPSGQRRSDWRLRCAGKSSS